MFGSLVFGNRLPISAHLALGRRENFVALQIFRFTLFFQIFFDESCLLCLISLFPRLSCDISKKVSNGSPQLTYTSHSQIYFKTQCNYSREVTDHFFVIDDQILNNWSKYDLRSDQDHDWEFSKIVIGDQITITDQDRFLSWFAQKWAKKVQIFFLSK